MQQQMMIYLNLMGQKLNRMDLMDLNLNLLEMKQGMRKLGLRHKS